MDTATANVLISGSAGLIGAAIGGFTTYFAGAQQHKRQVEKERRDARRDREHTAAKDCESLCVQMTDDMEKVRHPAAEPDDTDSQREERVDAAHRRLTAAVLYLPTDLRERVEGIGNIVRNASELYYGSPMGGSNHYHRPYTICWHARREIRAIIAAFIKGEPIPKPNRFIVEYQVALDELNEERKEYYSLYDEHDRQKNARKRNQEEFYKRYPKLRRDEADDE